MENRINALLQGCKHHGLDGIDEETYCRNTSSDKQYNDEQRYKQYFIPQRNNLHIAWCKVPKSASTR